MHQNERCSPTMGTTTGFLPWRRFALFLTTWVVLLANVSNAQPQTIADIISQRSDLSRLRNYLTGTDIFNRLRLTTSTYTFFAPNNNAFVNVSEQVRNMMNNPSTPTSYFNGMFSYHTTQAAVQTSSVSDSNPVLPIQSLATGAPRLFLVYTGEVFVNGAQFVTTNVGGVSNGILHIIDSVLYEPRITTNAYTYIRTTAPTFSDPKQKTSMFSALLDSYKYAVSTTRQIRPAPNQDVIDNMLNSVDGIYTTAFIPNDEALAYFQSYNVDRYTSVLGGSDPTLLQKVIESHVIQSRPYHTDVLESLTSSGTQVMAVQGRIRVYRLNNALYVSNNCVQAKVTQGNITALNGVIHMIDNILGFVYLDAFTQIQRDTLWLYEFYGTVQASTRDILDMLTVPNEVTGNIPDSQKVTIFAPIGKAYNHMGRRNDFSQDLMTLRSQLLQVMLPGVIEITQMHNGTKLPTKLEGQYVTFYQFGDNHYVEVDYVRAKIVQAGVCVRNGIIHKVDEILGVPCCSIFGTISFEPQLSDLRDVIVNNALENLLKDTSQNLTLFAPIDFSEMRNSKLGLTLINNRLNARRMRNVMLRHVVNGFLILDNLPPGNKTIDMQYDRITVSTTRRQEYFVLIGTLRIQVLRANIRTKNGIMHIIQQVIFDPDDPRSGQPLTSSGQRLSAMTVMNTLDLSLVVAPVVFFSKYLITFVIDSRTG